MYDEHDCLCFDWVCVDLTGICSSVIVGDLTYVQVPVIGVRSFYTDPRVIYNTAVVQGQ